MEWMLAKLFSGMLWWDTVHVFSPTLCKVRLDIFFSYFYDDCIVQLFFILTPNILLKFFLPWILSLKFLVMHCVERSFISASIPLPCAQYLIIIMLFVVADDQMSKSAALWPILWVIVSLTFYSAAVVLLTRATISTDKVKCVFFLLQLWHQIVKVVHLGFFYFYEWRTIFSVTILWTYFYY